MLKSTQKKSQLLKQEITALKQDEATVTTEIAADETKDAGLQAQVTSLQTQLTEALTYIQENVPNVTCTSSGDPHYNTIGKSYYSFYGTGDFILLLTSDA